VNGLYAEKETQAHIVVIFFAIQTKYFVDERNKEAHNLLLNLFILNGALST
jgi:hypothetical protein